MSITITTDHNGELKASLNGEPLVPACDSGAREELLDKVVYLTERAIRSRAGQAEAQAVAASLLDSFRELRGEGQE